MSGSRFLSWAWVSGYLILTVVLLNCAVEQFAGQVENFGRIRQITHYNFALVAQVTEVLVTDSCQHSVGQHPHTSSGACLDAPPSWPPGSSSSSENTKQES